MKIGLAKGALRLFAENETEDALLTVFAATKLLDVEIFKDPDKKFCTVHISFEPVEAIYWAEASHSRKE